MSFIRTAFLIISLGSLTAQPDEKWEKAGRQYEENARIAARYPVEDLKKAIDEGDAKTLKRLLDDGVPASCPLPWSKDSWEGYPPPTDYPIHLAAGSGHIEIVRLLLDYGASAKAHGCEGNFTPLHAANGVEIAKLLISRGADVNARDNLGSQPIHYKACTPDLAKLLISHGADPLAQDDHEYQPIHGAASSGNAEDVAFFLDLKAKVDAAVHDKEGHSSWNGWQPLHFATSRDDMDEALEVAELLIRKGSGVNAVTAEGETPLHLSKNVAMTKLLLRHDAKPDVMSTGTIKQQPIHHFAMRGDKESIKLLLDRGVDIEAKSALDDQTTALDTAAFWGKIDTVKFLLERGAKPTERTMRNARRFDDNPIEIVRMLHQNGGIVSADMFLDHPQTCDSLLPFLSQKTKDALLKHSAQHIAEAASSPYHREAEGSLGIIRALIALGANTDQPWDGLLPIHHAVISGKEAVVGYFLSTGQPINAKGTLRDNDAEPPIVITDIQPIHIALGSPEIIPFLIEKGAKIDALTGEGWQPVHLAAAHGDKATLEAVIKAGGNPKAKTRGGKTPLQLAEEFSNEESAEYLRGLP